MKAVPVCSLSLALGLLGSRLAAGPLMWEPLYEPGCGGAIVSVEGSPHHPDHVVSGGDMLGTAVTFDGGKIWHPGLGLPSYEMATPTFHPTRTNDVWIGSCMGPFLSHDGGRTWIGKRAGMPAPTRWKYTVAIEKVLVDVGRPGRLLAFGGSSRGWAPQCETLGSIWESVDDGENWRRLGTITVDGFTTNVVKGANIVQAYTGPDGWVHLFAGRAGWFTSLDQGVTWRKRKVSGIDAPLESVTCHPRDPQIFWAVSKPVQTNGTYVAGHLWKSVDRCRTFQLCDGGIKHIDHKNPNHVTHFSPIAVSPVDPNLLYTSDLSWSANAIWASDDGGANWRLSARKATLTIACPAGPGVRLSTSPCRRGTAYAYNSEYVLKTEDGGRTWEDLTSTKCSASGETPVRWRGRGWNGWCSRGVVFNPHQKGVALVYGMDASRGWLSVDGFRSWSYAHGSAGPWGGGQGAAFSSNGVILVTSGQYGWNTGVTVSSDGGRTWRTRLGAACGLPEREGDYGGAWVSPDGRTGFVLHKTGLYRTADGGETWTHDTACTETGVFAEDTTHPGRFYVKNMKDVFVTDDWHTFTPLGLPGKAEGEITCDAKGRVLVCRGRDGSNFGLFRYDPAQPGWRRLTDVRLARAAAADPVDPRRIVLVTADNPYHDFAGGDGVYVSSDDGATWTRANDGLHIRRLTCVAFDPFDPEVLVAGTGGGGFVTARWRR